MSGRIPLIVRSVFLIAGAVAIYAQDRAAPRDPAAETRLKLARQGYDSVQARLADTHHSDVLNEVPIWSLRIMEARRDAGGDAVAAAREHLERMRKYAGLTEARHKTGQGLDSSAIDGAFRVAEAESLLFKVGGK